MKNIFLIIVINILIPNNLLAIEKVYESSFYKVDTDNKNISSAKIIEIEKIKILTLDRILKNILTKSNFKNVKKIIQKNSNFDHLIKSIIIENEFITKKKYSANIKINFSSKDIINILRNNKINYTDFESENILLLVVENNQISKEGLSYNNGFYKNINTSKFQMLNFIYPDLSQNDRFILPYKKIIEKDFKSIKFIAEKYKNNLAFIINIKNKNQIHYFDISFFSSKYNDIIYIGKIQIDSKLDLQNELFNFLDDWWKKNNFIDNSIVYSRSCSIKNANIHELYFINSKINELSQVKSNTISSINLGLNTYDILFYGNFLNLTSKLSKFKIDLSLDSQGKCIISTFN